MPFRTNKPPRPGALRVVKAQTKGCTEDGLRIEIDGQLFCDVPQGAELLVVRDELTDEVAAIFGPAGDSMSKRDAAQFVVSGRLAQASENLLTYMHTNKLDQHDAAGGLYLLTAEVRTCLNLMESGHA
ncbi:hypothetical protein DEH84_06905 [Aquabacterium olei]|uniref:Uncharacterized protein n=1 Tax=Aquabacterium olei TaxID=1296669 RepID=A0A2U8FQR9_9BURK|nr:hypothetical protein [Aquabacterium olei]AWI53188.1 hypothetical protein DEH84_06905 [Aquabacterium olei]